MMFVNKIPSIIILFLLVLCLILLAILISTSESYIFILAQLILDKLKRFMIIINFWNTVLDAIIMHHIISCHSSMHSVASWSGICRLTNGYALSTTSWVVFGSYLIVAGAIGLPLLIAFVVEFSHITLMPRRNLDSRVCCSHMIELLGARWCLVCVT